MRLPLIVTYLLMSSLSSPFSGETGHKLRWVAAFFTMILLQWAEICEINPGRGKWLGLGCPLRSQRSKNRRSRQGDTWKTELKLPSPPIPQSSEGHTPVFQSVRLCPATIACRPHSCARDLHTGTDFRIWKDRN